MAMKTAQLTPAAHRTAKRLARRTGMKLYAVVEHAVVEYAERASVQTCNSGPAIANDDKALEEGSNDTGGQCANTGSQL